MERRKKTNRRGRIKKKGEGGWGRAEGKRERAGRKKKKGRRRGRRKN